MVPRQAHRELNLARQAIRRTISAAPCWRGRRPSGARKIGPSQRSPMARSITRSVRDSSGMVTTLPPSRAIVIARWQHSVPSASMLAPVASETRSPVWDAYARPLRLSTAALDGLARRLVVPVSDLLEIFGRPGCWLTNTCSPGSSGIRTIGPYSSSGRSASSEGVAALSSSADMRLVPDADAPMPVIL
jgi:hypothetical protein